MVFEPPGVTPPEPYLVAFWYALPAIGLYVIGRGAVEFVRLFFDRSERRDAWEVAVASTYRNHIIVLGVGHLGQRVMRALVDMGFDVVVIDLKVDAELGRELNDLSVPAIIGDGRSTVTLEDAGLHHAQTLIVCTSNDHANLEVTMRARDMNPNIRIVVRMWDDQFAAQMQRFMGVEAVLSASDLAAPVFAGSAVGVEITQTLTIDDVDYSMIRLTVERQSFMDNSTIDVLQEDNDIDIVLHGHGGQMQVHPDGDIPVTAGDTLVIFAHHNKITGIVSRNRRGSNGSD
jgi:Trk K+ transport system NAD-binding subunit